MSRFPSTQCVNMSDRFLRVPDRSLVPALRYLYTHEMNANATSRSRLHMLGYHSYLLPHGYRAGWCRLDESRWAERVVVGARYDILLG